MEDRLIGRIGRWLLLAGLVAILGLAAALNPATAAQETEQLPPRPPTATPTATLSPTPSPTPPPVRTTQPIGDAPLGLALQSSFNQAVGPNEELLLTIVIVNESPVAARNLVLELPFNGALFSAIDAGPPNPLWTFEAATNTLRLSRAELAAQSRIEHVIRFRLAAGLPTDLPLFARASLRWANSPQALPLGSNELALRSGATSLNVVAFPVELEGDRLRSARFAPYEPVGLWINPAGGGTLALTTIRADRNGQIEYLLNRAALPTGEHSLVAFGHWSTVQLLAPVVVVR